MARTTHRDTKGRALLAKYLDDHSQTELASKLGIGQQTVSAWKTGRARPEAHHRKALQRIAKIPESAWCSPDELAVARGRPASTTRTGTDG